MGGKRHTQCRPNGILQTGGSLQSWGTGWGREWPPTKKKKTTGWDCDVQGKRFNDHFFGVSNGFGGKFGVNCGFESTRTEKRPSSCHTQRNGEGGKGGRGAGKGAV